MAKQKPYDELAIVPTLIAQSVHRLPYTGAEMGSMMRSPTQIAETERRRQAMTPEMMREFEDLVEQRCRNAYETGTPWMLKIAAARGDRGRDQLHDVWIPHWLSAYLDNPDTLRQQCRELKIGAAR